MGSLTARPLIGVSTSEIRPLSSAQPRPHSDPPRAEMALGMTYIRSLERCGAVPVVLPPLEVTAIDALLPRLDGVLLSGGPDLDPSVYGASAHPDLGPTWAVLDRFELAIARRADPLGMPLLGICRGAQTLNVTRAGTLLQHLPHAGDVMIEHRQQIPGEITTHGVEILPSSAFEKIVRRRDLVVNSFHHQAVRQVGRGLRVAALAPDGVVEAIEDPAHRFFFGVQWHAEFLVSRPAEAALFAAFVEAARGYRADAEERPTSGDAASTRPPARAEAIA